MSKIDWSNKEEVKNYVKQQKIINASLNRARVLLGSYKREDKKYGRGQGNLTPEWIVVNIFTQPCAHCGKTGWNVIGCNRLDNSKPHTMDNVEPCCVECNRKLRSEDIKKRIGIVKKGTGKKVYQYDKKTKELIGVWGNAGLAAEGLGLSQGNINKCCNNKVYKSVGGYIWRFNPL